MPRLIYLFFIIFITQSAVASTLNCLPAQSFSMNHAPNIELSMPGVNAETLGALQTTGSPPVPGPSLIDGDIFVLQGTVPISVSQTWNNLVSPTCLQSPTVPNTSICTVKYINAACPNPTNPKPSSPCTNTVVQFSASKDGEISACVPLPTTASMTYQLPPAPSGVTGTAPEIIINQKNIDGTSSVVNTLNNASWGSTITQSFNFQALLGTSFTVNIGALNTQCTALKFGCSLWASPNNFSFLDSNNNPSQVININLSANAQLILNPQVSNGGSVPNAAPSYELRDKNNQLISQGSLSWDTNNPTTVIMASSGSPWVLYTPGIYNSSTKIQYLPSEGPSEIINLNSEQSETKTLTYNQTPCTIENLVFQIQGLPSGSSSSSSSTLTLSNGSLTEPMPLSLSITNGTQNFSICQDQKNWNINLGTVPDYWGVITPTSFTANQNTQNIQIQYNNHPLNSGLLVGYLQNWGTPISISQAAQMGYNLEVLAFACLSTETNQHPGCTLGSVDFYNGNFPGYDTPEAMREDILKAKSLYGLKYVLASFGGATIKDTYPTDQTNSAALAASVISFLNTYGLDGVDLDDEQSQNSDAPAMKLFLINLKSLKLANGQRPIISSAPQFNSVTLAPPPINKTAFELVSTQTNTAYNDSLQAGLFDYVFVQGYNTPGNFVNDCDEMMPCFITQAGGSYLANPLSEAAVPAATSIIMGEPASSTLTAAGAGVFQNNNIANPYQALANEYSLGILNPRLGGAMVWSINEDADAQCQFSQAIAPVVTGVNPSVLICP